MIGIYDSGVGGLGILREVRALLPDVDLVYLADQANVPYGEKPIDEVRALAAAAVGLLVERGVTTVVVACNTASATGLDLLRARFPDVSVVGMEPAIKPAAITTDSGVVGVLATPVTFLGEGYRSLVERFAADVEVVPHPCPGWAAAVEESWPDGADDEIRRHLAPMLERGVDTLVLACTHYGFVADVIRRVVGPDVAIVDPAPAVARQAARVSDGSGTGTTTYLTTGDPVRMAAQVERLLGDTVEVDSAG